MFTSLRDTVDLITENITTINELLLEKIQNIKFDLSKGNELEYFSQLKVFDLLEFISKEIVTVQPMVVKVNTILDNAETYLEDLINCVPHYDEVTVVSDNDYSNENYIQINEDDFEPYAQVYLDNLLEKVTNEELEHYTSDNGKIVQDCRTFIPNATILLNILIEMFQQLESLLNNDDLIHNDVHMCCGKINTFAITFSAFVDNLNI
jgi:hypothetical protein